MKRLISATLALSLLGATAAAAAPYDHGDRGAYGGNNSQGYSNGYGNRDRGDYRRDRGDNNAAIGIGFGFLTLAAILASQNHHHYHHGWYNRDGGRYGYDGDRGYHDNYGDRDGGYGYYDHR